MATILVVDDEQSITDLVELYLKNENYTVHKFYNGTTPWNASGRRIWIWRFWILCCRT